MEIVFIIIQENTHIFLTGKIWQPIWESHLNEHKHAELKKKYLVALGHCDHSSSRGKNFITIGTSRYLN